MRNYRFGERDKNIVKLIIRALNKRQTLVINGVPIFMTGIKDMNNFKINFITVNDEDSYFSIMDMRVIESVVFIPFSDIKEIRVNYKDIII